MALGGKALAALAAAALQDQTAGACRHPLTEAVSPGSFDVAWLKRPLHGQSSLNILEMNRERLGITLRPVKINGIRHRLQVMFSRSLPSITLRNSSGMWIIYTLYRKAQAYVHHRVEDFIEKLEENPCRRFWAMLGYSNRC